MTVIVSTPACEARVGFYPGDWAELPIYCSATVGLTTWRDSGGFTHRACRHHRDTLLRRYPRPELTTILRSAIAKVEAKQARRDAFEEGRLTFEWHGHQVDVDLA